MQSKKHVTWLEIELQESVIEGLGDISHCPVAHISHPSIASRHVCKWW